MKKAKIIIPIVLALAVATVIFVFATRRDPSAVEISKEEAEEIAVSYFNEEYSVDATVLSTVYRRITYDKVFLNCITVLIDNEEYLLLLDDENKPLIDSY